jgi:hypothetical protein
MGLYQSQIKKRTQENNIIPKLVETVSGGVLVDNSGKKVDSYSGYLPSDKKKYYRDQYGGLSGRLDNTEDLAQFPKQEIQQPKEEPIKKNGNVVVNDPITNKKRFFLDTPVKNVSGKSWDEMNWFDKFIAGGNEAGEMVGSLAGNVVLGGSSMALKGVGSVGRMIETINTFGTDKYLREKLGIKKSASQQLLDFANGIDNFKQEYFDTVSYKPEDINIKNIPKLLINPEFLLNSMSSMVMSGLAWTSGGMPALTALESGDILSERRADAILKGEKEETTSEVLFSAGMGLFNAWLENASFKIMSGTGKIPLTDALIKKISNNLVRNITSWGAKVTTEMGEEFIQEGLPFLVGAAVFKEKDDLRNIFQRSIDALPEAVKRGTTASIMAIPGAGLMSGFGVAQENAMNKEQQQISNKINSVEEQLVGTGEKIANSFKESMNDFKYIEEGMKDPVIAKSMKELGKELIKDGKLDIGVQNRITSDLVYKLDYLGEGGKLLSKFLEAGLKNKEFSNYTDYSKEVEGILKLGLPQQEANIFSKSINGEASSAPIQKVNGIKKDSTSTIRIKNIPKGDLKYIYQEAKKNGIDKTLAEAMTKPIKEEKISSLNEQQKAIMTTALQSVAENEGITEGSIIQNIKTLGGDATSVQQQSPSTSKPIPEIKLETNKKNDISNLDTDINRLQKIDNEAISKEASKKTEALSSRELLRTKISDQLKKDATVFADVKTGKGKASAFTLSIKKLPNNKYGYAISFNTPEKSNVIKYNPKFSSKEKALRMGTQKAIRMVEEARQSGVPTVGLSKIKDAILKLNKKLGSNGLSAKRVKKVLKEVSKGKGTKTGKNLKNVGSVAIGEFEKVKGEQPKIERTEKFRISQKSLDLIKKYAERVGEGHVKRGAKGTFSPLTNMIRTKGMTSISTIVHEITHYLDISKIGLSKRIIRELKRNDPLRVQLKNLYLKYYAGAKKTHPLETKITEGFATLLQKFVENPSIIENEFPDLVNAFFKKGGVLYNPLFEEIITDVRNIINEYQSLSPLEKISARITYEENLKTDNKAITVKDKIQSIAWDEIYPIEVLAKEKSGKWFTMKDISLWLRASQRTSKAVIANNIEGLNIGEKGYHRLVNGEIKSTLPYSWNDLFNMVYKPYKNDKIANEKNGRDWDSFLVSRRKYFEYKKLDDLKNTIDNLPSKLEQAFLDKEAKEKINEIKEQFDHLNTVIKNDEITRKEASEGFLAGNERFSKETEMFDALTREDLLFLNDSKVQLLSNEDLKEFLSNEGYASYKRASSFDELLGDTENIPRQMMIGKNKISSFFRRVGSSKEIISPTISAIRNHAEITRKGFKQIPYNMAIDYALEFPTLFEITELKPSVNSNSAIIYPQEKDPDIIMARRNFIRVPVLVNREIKSIFDNVLDAQNIDEVFTFLKFTSRTFIKGTTGLFLQFGAIVNPLLDQFTLAAQSRFGAIPFFSTGKLLYKILKDKEGEEAKFFKEYLMWGGQQYTLSHSADISAAEYIKRLEVETNALKKLYYSLEKGAGKLSDLLTFLSTKSEVLTRSYEYIQSRKMGESQVASFERAGRVTASFHHIGSLGGRGKQNWLKSIPFANAGLQVLHQAYNSITENKKTRERYAFVLASIMAAQASSLGALIAFGSDDDKRRYKGLTAEELSKYLYLPKIGGGFIKIRLSETLAMPGTVLNMIIADSFLKTNYSIKDYYTAITSPIPRQFNIPSIFFKEGFKEWSISLIPQFPKTIALTELNYKDYPSLIPLVGQKLARLEPSEQYTESTSLIAIKLGKIIDKSPIKIDALLTGIFGRSIGYATMKPSAYNFASPLIAKEYFYSTRQLQKYFDIKEENDIKYNTYRKSLEKRNKNRDEYIKIKNINQRVKSVTNELEVYNEIDEIKYPVRAENQRKKIFSLIDKL